ncbi:RNA polymerase II degradation factor 1-like [Nicotiana sylvestris]|uniref:RNA polymerase II degradation factor 1-like n=1 Tax=Nicotiana sylvestris TaxID=4096 RepID=UPI00388CD6CC
MIRLTPQVRQAIKDTKKSINAVDRAVSQSGSEYLPSRETFDSESVLEYVPDWPERHILRDTPPGTPTAQASVAISSESSEVSVEGSDSATFTSPAGSSPGEDPIDNAVPDEEGGYSLKGDDNPKDPKGKATASTGQSEEPVVVASSQPPSATPDIALEPSTSTIGGNPVRTSTAINSSLSGGDSQGASGQPEEAPGEPELPKKTKKLRKTRASKESVKELRGEVEKIKADHLPLELLLHNPVPAAKPEPEQEIERPAKRKRVIPQADDAVIELEDSQRASSSQPQAPEQPQVPVQTHDTEIPSQVPEQSQDPGTQAHDPMQTEGQ